jgi:hypothetical protein
MLEGGVGSLDDQEKISSFSFVTVCREEVKKQAARLVFLHISQK